MIPVSVSKVLAPLGSNRAAIAQQSRSNRAVCNEGEISAWVDRMPAPGSACDIKLSGEPLLLDTFALKITG